MLSILFACLAFVQTPAVRPAPMTAAVPVPALDRFPIVVWNQPKWRIADCKRLGFDTIVNGLGLGSERECRKFLDACRKQGVRGVLSVKYYTPALDRHRALAMWRLKDEPDLRRPKTAGRYLPRVDPAALAKTAAALRGRTKPLWLNTTVRFFEPYRKLDLDVYRRFYEVADVCGFDHYPVTGWNLPDRVRELEPATRVCVELAGGRPVIAIVEASDQDLAWTPKETRGPTAAEMRAEVLLALVGGARGIGYFTIAFNKFRWNHLTPEIDAELRRTNGELRRLSSYLFRTPAPEAAVTSTNDEVRCALRPGPGGSFLVIAVNRSRAAQRTTLRITGKAAAAAGLRRVGDGDRHEVAGGEVELRFGPLEASFFEVVSARRP